MAVLGRRVSATRLAASVAQESSCLFAVTCTDVLAPGVEKSTKFNSVGARCGRIVGYNAVQPNPRTTAATSRRATKLPLPRSGPPPELQQAVSNIGEAMAITQRRQRRRLAALLKDPAETLIACLDRLQAEADRMLEDLDTSSAKTS